jgi:hypothetical protein
MPTIPPHSAPTMTPNSTINGCISNVGSSQVLEKERMPLQESDNRIDQVCEEDRKSKEQKDAPRNVKKHEHQGK